MRLLSNQVIAGPNSALTDETFAELSATHVSGLFGRDMVYLASWAGQLVLAAALTPVATRLMPASQFGRTAAALAVMQLMNALLGFGLGTAVQQAYAGERGEDDARRLVTLAILMVAVAGGIAYATGRWWCPLVGLGPFPASIRYAVILGGLTALTGPALSLVRSRDQLGWFIAASFAQSLFAQALALALVAFVSGTAQEFVFGQMIGQLVAVILVLWAARPRAVSSAHIAMLSASLKFSLALVPALIASFLLDAADRLVIHGDLGAIQLGHYVVACNIGRFAIVLLGLLDFVWLPRLFGITDPAVRRRVLGHGREGLYVLVVAFVVGISAGSPILLAAWSPPSYHSQDLLLITALVAASAIPVAQNMICTEMLILDGRSKAVAAVAVVGAIVNLGLNLALVPILGIDASAGVTLCSAALSVVIAQRLTRRFGLPETRRTLLITVGGVVLCIACAAIPTDIIGLAVRLMIVAGSAAIFLVRLFTLARPAPHAAAV
jgi:O-antigen/teichoic acid export membrane protein